MSGGPVWIRALGWVPKNALSRSVGRLAATRSKMAVRQFAARYGLDLDEAEKPLEAYDSVADLFTRRLKPEARPVDPRPDVLVSPIDGSLFAHGSVTGEPLMQAKGRTYALGALLADEAAAATFEGGSYCCLYLSPRDYHRVHMPTDGEVLGYTHVPGDLFPVNEASVKHVDGLYAKNERVITHLAGTPFGRVAVVKVGATNVGRIRLTYAPDLLTNRRGASLSRKRFVCPPRFARGDELAVFELGSTVILVIERPVAFFPLGSDAGSEPDSRLRMGKALGRRAEL